MWEDLKEKLISTGDIYWINKFREGTETSEIEANKSIQEMCEKLLANTVIESYEIEII